VNDPKPRVLGFEKLGRSSAAGQLRGVRAWQSLERYIGWPTMLDAISRLRTSGPSSWDVATLARTLSDARGTNMRFLVEECFRESASFDYAVEAVQSRSVVPGQVESIITVVRRGTGRFAIAESAGDPVLPVRAQFADGRQMRDRIDGAVQSATLTYTAPVAVVRATVDPDVMLVLDDDRDNHTVGQDTGRSKLGVRLALHWLAWLQNTMLTYTALL
jgi:hypothetical protein